MKNTEYEKLNSIRVYALSLPVDNKIRLQYRDYKRYLHNVAEDVELTSDTSADIVTTNKRIESFVDFVQTLIADSTLLIDLAAIPGKGTKAKAQREALRQAESERIAPMIAARIHS